MQLCMLNVPVCRGVRRDVGAPPPTVLAAPPPPTLTDRRAAAAAADVLFRRDRRGIYVYRIKMTFKN